MTKIDLYGDDEALVKLANACRIALPSSPSQSNFRVYCILVVVIENEMKLIHGTNGEQGYIGGAICAERAALLQLGHYKSPIIKKVVITTDANAPVAPGVLCREYLLSHADDNAIIVLGNCESTMLSRCFLKDLYPCPYVYRHQRRQNIQRFAEEFAAGVAPLEDKLLLDLHRKAMDATVHDSCRHLHPLRFAAAVLYDDGDVEVAWMLKALEYGNTLDPISQLIVGMERRRVAGIDNSLGSSSDDDVSQGGVRPRILVMVDQFGVCHAPFAMARSLLTEHNYGHIKCIVHDVTGKVDIITASSLVASPTGDAPLTTEEFKQLDSRMCSTCHAASNQVSE